MLPSLRLVVVTFMLGFALMFAGLRVFESTRVAHQPIALMQGSSAPVQLEGFFTSDWRGAEAPLPSRFDSRFAASSTASADTVQVSLTRYASARAAVELGIEAMPISDPLD